MRVLLAITRGDSIGGAQLYVRNLAARLHRDGHDVLVVTGTTGTLTHLLEEAGVATVACPSLRRQLHPVHDAKAIVDMARLIRAFRPDLVSAHSSKAGVVARIASQVRGVPCVFTAHGWAFAGGISQPGRTIWNIIERLMEPLAARIICVSNFDRDLALANGFKANRVVTIRNGIPDEPAPIRSNPVPGAQARIIMVARFFAQKDHPGILRAIRDIPNCELDLVGDGPLEKEMKDLATRLGVRDRVHFHGYQPDVRQLLSTASLFVLASHYEGFPLTTLEAMRSGLPTVVSNVGGAGEAVVDGITGYVVASGDVNTLRDRIRTLVDQPGVRAEMGAAGRALFVRSFTFEHMYRDTLAQYLDVARPSLSSVHGSKRTGPRASRLPGASGERRTVTRVGRLIRRMAWD
jgi:glycosyltransferase involved in cell wall biosynthesis